MKTGWRQTVWAVACLVLGVVACQSGSAGGSGTQAIGRPECPSDSFAINVIDTLRSRKGNVVTQARTVTRIGIAGPISTVPEFHDCQQFIRGDGYLRLYAIFARFHLEMLADSLDTLPYTPAKRAKAAAEIYSDGERYTWLGVEPSFNCLYVYRVLKDWRATMVPKGAHEDDCLSDLVDPATQGTQLEVHRVTPSAEPRAYPPVARWDWDRQSGWQYVGIMCGAGWCDIGPKGFTSSPALLAGGPPFDPILGVTPSLGLTKHVYEVKGWYDEQRLAAVASGGGLQPGAAQGIIIPNPVLGQLNNPSDFHQSSGTPWVHVAYVLLTGSSPYSSKLRLQSGWNKIYLCYGAAAACGVPPEAQTCSPGGMWWALIKPPHWWQRKTYRCVTQRLHPGIVISATVRWRWLMNDETGWIRCVQNGCCQVN